MQSLFGKVKIMFPRSTSRAVAIVNSQFTKRLLSTPVTIDIAKKLPRNWAEIPNEDVVILSKQGLHEAREERLRRNIMVVDSCDYEAACAKLDQINQDNDNRAWLMTLPYKVGALTGLTAAVSSIPLVFDLNTAAWFAANVVHEDPPEGGLQSLDTIWKVGNWTWGWMEPYLGTASFVLLGFQFSRSQMQHIGWMPYTERIKRYRADRLVKKYPTYNEEMLRDFAETDPWH